MKTALRALSASLVVIAAFIAGPSSVDAAQSDWLVITQVRVYQDGGAVVWVNGPDLPTVCTNKNAFRIDPAAPGVSEMIRTATAAFLAGREVRVDTTNNCSPGFDNINYLSLR